jgi:hypothetical protein
MIARNALLGACLVLPFVAYGGSAMAGAPSGPQTIAVPPGAVVLILPGASEMASPAVTAAALPAGDPLLRMVAEQDAMMRDMMAETNAAFAQPTWPFTQPIGLMQIDRTIRAAFGGLPTNVPGGGIVVTSFSGGPGVCSERMTYVYPANGAKPQVTVTRSGDACDSLGATAPRSVTQTTPAQRPDAPTVAPSRGPRLWSVSDPPQPITPNGTPRS